MSMNPEFIVFGSPRIEEAEINEMAATLRSGWIGTGPKVAAFEEAFRTYKKAPHAVAVNSCTAALHLSLLAAGVGPGDEVITTAMTFCATVNAIIHTGATPVLVDIDPVTLNMDPGAIEARITSRTKVILPVHFAGRPCAMDAIGRIAAKRGLRIIEDCAHAIEATYHGRPVGLFGDFGCFSFYVTKNMTTGEGGMVLSQNEADAARIKTLALHGMSKDAWKRFGDQGYKHYYVTQCGFKYNMTDMQASLGIPQLARIDTWLERREFLWARYDRELAGMGLDLPAPPEPDTTHARHLYTVLIDEQRVGIDRDRFLEGMTKHGIGVGVHYLAIPEHPYYQDTFGWRPEDFPVAQRIGRQTVSLPLSPKLRDGDADRVLAAVHALLAKS